MATVSKRDKIIMEERQKFIKQVYEIAFGEGILKRQPELSYDDVIKELQKMRLRTK